MVSLRIRLHTILTLYPFGHHPLSVSVCTPSVCFHRQEFTTHIISTGCSSVSPRNHGLSERFFSTGVFWLLASWPSHSQAHEVLCVKKAAKSSHYCSTVPHRTWKRRVGSCSTIWWSYSVTDPKRGAKHVLYFIINSSIGQEWKMITSICHLHFFVAVPSTTLNGYVFLVILPNFENWNLCHPHVSTSGQSWGGR